MRDGGGAESQEELKRRLLESIARSDDADEEEQARHARFLKAKEEAAAAAKAKPKAKAKPESGGRSDFRPQVRVSGEVFDADVGSRLEAYGRTDQRDEQDRARHERFLEAKEAGFAAAREAKQRDQILARETLAADAVGSEAAAQSLSCDWISDQEYRELGYPEIDPRFRDKQWIMKQMEIEQTDPRENPNLGLDQNNPEFWYNAARKPFNKAMLRSEQHWDGRRQCWVKQYEQVQRVNSRRAEVLELLEDCSNEVKRIVAPIMKYSITMTMLGNVLDRAREQGKSFGELLEEKESRDTLQRVRSRIDHGGDEAAEAMMSEYDTRWRALAQTLHTDSLEQERQERKIADVQTLAAVMNWGTKCKKDGMLEWDKGHWDEAHASWRQADEALRKFKAADKTESKMVFDLHIAVLKNLAQACIKLEYWTDALAYADAAIDLDPDDHKAWFRRACALEGLGRIDEADECLARVDDCSVGRPDRARITSDTQARREKLHAIRERGQEEGRRMVEIALEQGVFSDGREAPPRAPAKLEDEAARAQAHSPAAAPAQAPADEIQDATRKRLTKEGAEDLLTALRDTYRDTTFQLQVRKLAVDVRRDKDEFLANLKKLALPLQRPLLERWGFEPSPRGVREMNKAVQDFLRGPKADARVKQLTDETTQTLFGCMYDELTLPGPPEAAGAEPRPARG